MFSSKSVKYNLYLRITLCCKCLIENGFNRHPFKWKFSVPFGLIHLILIDVTSETKVRHLCNFFLTDKDVASSQIAMNKSLLREVLLIRKKIYFRDLIVEVRVTSMITVHHI